MKFYKNNKNQFHFIDIIAKKKLLNLEKQEKKNQNHHLI